MLQIWVVGDTQRHKGHSTPVPAASALERLTSLFDRNLYVWTSVHRIGKVSCPKGPRKPTKRTLGL